MRHLPFPLLLLGALALTGCLSAAQLREIAKIKDAGAVCVSVHQMVYGDLRIAVASIDKGIVGQALISKECEISLTTAPPTTGR